MRLWIILILASVQAMAQVSTFQSDSDLNWQKIEDDQFVVVFPDFMEERAQYTLNLLKHYAKVVGKTYRSQPKKISIVIRPQVNSPNGFVTLAPRRSEWFNHASLTPLVGSLEWMQALAVHEYRHVVQFDAMKNDNLLWPYYLFGEGFLSLFMNIVMPTWYFEGDATWAETVYSDGGRGRSPRFMARMKALSLGDDPPTYDQLLGGDFTTALPNWYVYGYILVTKAVNVYGEDIWRRILEYAIARPWNVYALYTAFEAETGMEFDTFFEQTMNELRDTWKSQLNKPFKKSKRKSYRNQVYPLENKVYLYRDLNSLWELKQGQKTLAELNVSPSLSRVDKHHHRFVYTSLLPHHRYFYKSFSDLFEFDLKKGDSRRISFQKRYYHPQYSPNGSKLLAVNISEREVFSLHILKGQKVIKKIIPPKKMGTIAEAVWKNETELLVLMLDPTGKKYIAQYQIKNRRWDRMSAPTRNNLYSLFYHRGSVYFEADYLGNINIFRLKLNQKSFEQCSFEEIGAFQPRVILGKLYYAAEGTQGKKIKGIDINCEPMVSTALTDINRYIGSTPSDNYFEKKPIKIKNFKKFYKKTRSVTDYQESSNTLSPHSWSFISGRGFQLQGTGTNILGSQNLTAYTGLTSEENTPFAGFAYSYSKFYPLLSFGVDYLERSQTINDVTSDWKETKAIAAVILPYSHVTSVFEGFHQIAFIGQYIGIGENLSTASSNLSDDELLAKGISFSSSLSKFRPFRDLISPLSFNLNLGYLDIEQESTSVANYLAQGFLSVTTPGFMENDGLYLSASAERRPQNRGLYNLLNNYVPTTGYTFGRGFAYEFTPQFNLYSLEYITPLFYPRWNLSDWFYFPRINAKFWFDHTQFEKFDLQDSDYSMRSLNSQGIDFIINSNTLRKFSINYGLRFFNRSTEAGTDTEFFINVNL